MELNSVTYFDSYEEREEVFRQKIGTLIPRKYAGPTLFWDDFSEIWRRDPLKTRKGAVMYVSGNPRDSLAFASTWQVLRAAALRAEAAGRGEPADTAVTLAVTEYDLEGNLQQPIRTLSGGETVKVALAKCRLMASCSKRLVMASPFSWLSKNNLKYLEKTTRCYVQRKLPVELLGLAGEDSTAPVDLSLYHGKAELDPLPFEMAFENVEIMLGAAVSAFDTHQAVARVDNIGLTLESPCLVVGENGQGKSLLAKALSRAVSHEGDILIEATGGDIPSARLIFQDVSVQTLLRPFAALAALEPGGARKDAFRLYETIRSQISTLAIKRDLENPMGMTGAEHTPRSLLDIKTMLAAARLTRSPGMLILDEPDWGLTRESTVAWVLAVVTIAHGLGIPIMIISHKPWWEPVANSVLRLRKEEVLIRDGVVESFRIRLDPI